MYSEKKHMLRLLLVKKYLVLSFFLLLTSFVNLKADVSVCSHFYNSDSFVDQSDPFKKKDPSFYPNPVTTLLNVEVSSNYDEPSLHLQLFDITGRIVLSQQLDMADTFTHSVAVNHLAKGTYVVKIVGQSYVQSQKITVK